MFYYQRNWKLFSKFMDGKYRLNTRYFGYGFVLQSNYRKWNNQQALKGGV